ncbi:hypothetical protein [Reyranella sp.]|uniref:hypothetical protein n=1 Tax=Reyranella sp. TaxID=1929291 RepID=UPI003783D23C
MNAALPCPRPLGDRLEHELHAAVAQFLRLALRPPTTWTTFPAGGGGLERGRQLARLGLRPGWPDILVLHPAPTAIDGCRRVILVGLELKTEIGRQSQVQRGVEADFTSAGATYALCRSIDDVADALARAGVPMHATAGRRQ